MVFSTRWLIYFLDLPEKELFAIICNLQKLASGMYTVLLNRLLHSLGTRSFSEHRFVPVYLNRKDIVKIFLDNLAGSLVQPLFLSLLG